MYSIRFQIIISLTGLFTPCCLLHPHKLSNDGGINKYTSKGDTIQVVLIKLNSSGYSSWVRWGEAKNLSLKKEELLTCGNQDTFEILRSSLGINCYTFSWPGAKNLRNVKDRAQHKRWEIYGSCITDPPPVIQSRLHFRGHFNSGGKRLAPNMERVSTTLD